MKAYEEISSYLMEQISTGRLIPGDKLPAERILAKNFGVSRPAIREAVRSLELMGCVESRVGDGTYIKAPSFSNVVNPFSMVLSQDKEVMYGLMEVRIILETEVAGLAAKRRTEEQLHALEDTLVAMQKDIDAGGNGNDADTEFHNIMAQSTANVALNTIISMCSGMLSRTRPYTQNIKGMPEIALGYHKLIYGAIAEKNGKKARQYMHLHLCHAQRNLKFVIK